MKFRLFFSFISSFSFLIALHFARASESELDPKVTLKVHAVGQGNCVSLEVRKPGTKRSEFMLVDIGSSSFENEAAYRQYQMQSSSVPQAILPVTSQPETPPTTPSKKNPPIPESIKKSPNWAETQEDKTIKKASLKEFITQMRQMLKQDQSSSQQKESRRRKIQDKDVEKTPPIYVKTVVITHPDADHYNKLMTLFSREDDKIDFLIFGGLPSHYFNNSNDHSNFKAWLSLRLKENTQIFFPAIQYEPLNPQEDPLNPLKEILEKEEREEFAPHIFSGCPSFAKLALAKAFDFHPNVIISLLSLNPLHIGELGDVVRFADDEEDANKESIVLKVQHGQSSVLLTGDATQTTTRRIHQNYKSDPDFYKSTVLLASHHGSAKHGCNSEKWIRLVDPKYVLISHGYNKKYGHPHAEAYENFKKSSQLVQVPGHHVLVGRGTNQVEDYYEGSLHTTFRAIYSTLNSGTLTLELLPTTLTLTPEIFLDLESQIESEEPVEIEEKQEEILLSVKKTRTRRHDIPNQPIKLDFEERMNVDKPPDVGVGMPSKVDANTTAIVNQKKRKTPEATTTDHKRTGDKPAKKAKKEEATSSKKSK